MVSGVRDWFLTLRAANLPTVWSNVLLGAGLAATGELPLQTLAGLIAGVSCIYLGGMAINDAVDVVFDRRNASTRPVASGRITPRAAIVVGILLLLLGWIILSLTAGESSLPVNLSLLLVLLVSLYQWTHRASAVLAAVLMAACRMLVPAIAAATVSGDIAVVVWMAMVGVGCWTIGLTVMGRGERGGERVLGGGWMWLAAAAIAIPAVAIISPVGDLVAAVAGLLIVLVAWIPTATGRLRAGQIGEAMCWAIAGFGVLDSAVLLAAGQPVWAGGAIVCAAAALGAQRLGGGS